MHSQVIGISSVRCHARFTMVHDLFGDQINVDKVVCFFLVHGLELEVDLYKHCVCV